MVENPLTKEEAFKLIKLTKEMNPNAHKIMIAGGRELMFGEDQYDVFNYGANAIVIGDYLTTKGNMASKDIEELEKRNIPIAPSCN